MNPSAPSDRQHNITQAMILFYSWYHLDAIHPSFISVCNETHQLFKLTLQTGRGRRKRKKTLHYCFWLTPTIQPSHSAEICIYVDGRIVFHLLSHKIIACTPHNYKVLILSDCIFGQRDTSKLGSKTELPRARQSFADVLTWSNLKGWFWETVLGCGSRIHHQHHCDIYQILADWSSFPWIAQSTIFRISRIEPVEYYC